MLYKYAFYLLPIIYVTIVQSSNQYTLEPTYTCGGAEASASCNKTKCALNNTEADWKY